jgi:hypothetical protein
MDAVLDGVRSPSQGVLPPSPELLLVGARIMMDCSYCSETIGAALIFVSRASRQMCEYALHGTMGLENNVIDH